MLCMTLGNSPSSNDFLSANEPVKMGNFLNSEKEVLHRVMKRSNGRVELMELL